MRAISSTLSYLSPVRDSEVVYHEHVPLLPAIEHQVPPHCVPNMVKMSVWYLRTISITGVETNVLWANKSEENELEQPREPVEEPVLERAKTLVNVSKVTGDVGSVKHLQKSKF